MVFRASGDRDERGPECFRLEIAVKSTPPRGGRPACSWSLRYGPPCAWEVAAEAPIADFEAGCRWRIGVGRTGRIPGSAASEHLAHWYVRTEDQLRALLTAAESGQRPDRSAAAREGLRVSVDGPKRLFLSASDSRAEADAASP